MSAPGVTREELVSVDLPLGSGRQTLRITRSEESLTLAAGFGGGDTTDPFLRPSWGGPPLILPADVLPKLRKALEALEGAG